MTTSEQWQAWRAAGQGNSVSTADYLRWVDEYTSENADPEGLFVGWRNTPDHSQRLERALAGDIVSMGTGPQLVLGFFYALYQVLNGRKCFIASSMQPDLPQTRSLCKHISQLGKLNIRVMGPILMAEKVYLGDCREVDVAIVDYYQLMGASRRNHDLFAKTVQNLFILEIDLALYCTRLIVFERGQERAAGLVYKSSSKLPENWQNNNDFMDVPSELRNFPDTVLGGCYSFTDKYAANEMKNLLKDKLTGALPIVSHRGHTEFTYRTSQERSSALVNDVVRLQTNTLIVCCTDQTRMELQEEFRKSGLETTLTTRSADVVTFFTKSASQEKQQKIMIMRGIPASLVAPPAPLCDGALFLAEHFLTDCMHEKVYALSEAVFHTVQPPRVYFSLEDQLFTMYAEEGGFNRLFDLIDFTEKYDPWRQIRRVLAKSMAKKLHKLRSQSLDEETPLITMALSGSIAPAPPAGNQKKVLSRMDAPCFCGSGKPFRECHGKKKA